MRFSDNPGGTHHLPCSKGGQQGDCVETIRFAVTVHPSIGRVRLFIHPLEGSINPKADLDMDLNVPKFNVFFPDTSFSLDTARSALDSAVRADPALAFRSETKDPDLAFRSETMQN